MKDADGRPCSLVRRPRGGGGAPRAEQRGSREGPAPAKPVLQPAPPAVLSGSSPVTAPPDHSHTPPPKKLLVDCEGVDAVDQGQKHSAQVFSLAVLLSSVFVYNQLGAIDAVALERLAMVCELAKRIKDRSGRGAGGGGGGGQADFHPAFVWLLRDFQLQLSAGGRGGPPLAPAAYLEEALADVRGGGAADEGSRNQVCSRGLGEAGVACPCGWARPIRHRRRRARAGRRAGARAGPGTPHSSCPPPTRPRCGPPSGRCSPTATPPRCCAPC
jgi:hypothetical protein